MFSAALETEVTVNSVVARWSLTAQPGAERLSARSIVVRLTRIDGAKKRRSPDVKEQAGAGLLSDTTTVSGVNRFHFLLPATRYMVSLEAVPSDAGITSTDGGTVLLAQEQVTTSTCGRGMPPAMGTQIHKDAWMTYVGLEHELGEWLAESPEECVWAFQPKLDMMRALWLNACFTLPSPRSPITTCPNPTSRYCLDLTKSNRWLHGKKVRRHKGDFALTVNRDFVDTFLKCRDVHLDRGAGCWITPELVQALDACRRESGELKVYSVELWEKNTGRLAAAAMSLSVGDIFHDYTMAAMMRDNRSPGAILSKVLGHLLVQSGYKLWYWGFKNPYMAEYDEGYGGVTLDSREEFWPRWKAARAERDSGCDLAAHVQPGTTLDLASL